MSISFGEGTKSKVKCFTCQTDGVLVSVLAELKIYIKGSVSDEMMEKVSALEAATLEGEWAASGAAFRGLTETRRTLTDAFDPVWPSEFLETNFRKGFHKWLVEDRRISPEVCKEYETHYDPSQNRVVWPVRRYVDNALVGVLGRALRSDPSIPKYRDYNGFRKGHYFFGEHLVGEEDRLILVEGPLDALRLRTLGFSNVVGLMGVSASSVRLEKLSYWEKPVYLALDWDGAGKEARESLRGLLSRRLGLFDVPPVAGRKDPGELESREEFEEALSRAVWLPPEKRLDKRRRARI